MASSLQPPNTYISAYNWLLLTQNHRGKGELGEIFLSSLYYDEDRTIRRGWWCWWQIYHIESSIYTEAQEI